MKIKQLKLRAELKKKHKAQMVELEQMAMRSKVTCVKEQQEAYEKVLLSPTLSST